MAAKSGTEMKVGEYTINLASHIGSGAMGVIHPATDAAGIKVAAKRICGKDPRKMKKVAEDLNKLLLLDHQNIVKFYDVYQDQSTIWIFMEFCPHQDLGDFLSKRKVTNRQKLDIMIQIAEGIDYLQRRNIIHRDIKPSNILISNDNPIVVKLTDFDFSKFLEDDFDTSLMTTNVGTPAFKAPEFFLRNEQRKIEYHRNVDIYALGLTFLALIQGNKGLVPQIETPNDVSELHAPIGRLIAERIKYDKKPLTVIPKDHGKDRMKLFKGKRADSASAVNEPQKVMSEESKEIRKLIRGMTCPVPKDRLSAVQVLQDLYDTETKVKYHSVCKKKSCRIFRMLFGSEELNHKNCSPTSISSTGRERLI